MNERLQNERGDVLRNIAENSLGKKRTMDTSHRLDKVVSAHSQDVTTEHTDDLESQLIYVHPDIENATNEEFAAREKALIAITEYYDACDVTEVTIKRVKREVAPIMQSIQQIRALPETSPVSYDELNVEQ